MCTGFSLGIMKLIVVIKNVKDVNMSKTKLDIVELKVLAKKRRSFY